MTSFGGTGEQALIALERECTLVSRAVEGLPDDVFARPTRLALWNVKELLGHLWRDLDRLRVGISAPVASEADTTAVSYWRTYDPDDRGPAIAERARETAGAFRTGAGLARSFEENWRQGIVLARGEPPERLIVTWEPMMRLDEFVATRVLEVAVHGLDLADALDRDPWITPEATRITRAILVGLLGTEPPSSLAWEDITFIETGTGRRTLTDTDRAALDAAAHKFPLLA